MREKVEISSGTHDETQVNDDFFYNVFFTSSPVNTRIPFARKVGQRTLGYVELPVELIDMIFFHMDDPWTAFNFAACNTQLMVIGEKRIHELMGVPDWRGDRIMIVGDYTQEQDLPEGLDLGDDYKSFCKWKHGRRHEEGEDEDIGDEDEDENVKTSIYEWACEEFSDTRAGYFREEERCFTRDIDEFSPQWSIAWNLGKPDALETAPDVLWNLTKKVYVLRQSIPEKYLAKWGKHKNHEILGRILFSRIHWSSDPTSTACEESKMMHRGIWAGDRFEITGKDALKKRLEEDGDVWKDVTKEIAEHELGEHVWVY